jgi:hypothetical protein
MRKTIIVSADIWNITTDGLRNRSKTGIESTCVWAGERAQSECTVTKVYFLDDLLGVKRGARSYRVPRCVIVNLFEALHANKLKIIADLHTHPEDWVGLSMPDKEHPIEFRSGFISIVFPNYGRPCISLTEIGFHEFIGSGMWRQWDFNEVLSRFIIRS